VLGGRRKGGYPAHRHEFIELVLITGGSGIHLSDHGPRTLEAGDMLLFRPGAWHAYDRCVDLQMWDCSFLPGLLDRELAWLMHDPGCARLLWHGPLRDRAGFFHQHLDATSITTCLPPLTRLREMASDTNLRLARIGTLVELLGAIATCISPPERSRGMSTLAQRAVEMLAEDPARPWSAQGLAKRLGVDAAYLSRTVRAATGLPPMTYLGRLRAEQAAALLVGSDLQVSAIGSTVGWSDPVCFARRFKAHFGITASMYRQRARTVTNDRQPDVPLPHG
jgi:AraC family transcriptional regulator, L-rhamnose operon transcriptional activator RhaR